LRERTARVFSSASTRPFTPSVESSVDEFIVADEDFRCPSEVAERLQEYLLAASAEGIVPGSDLLFRDP
jgi:hypothetical protein